jgi:hypothetical protein
MHPAQLQALAAEHMKDMVAMADESRRAQHPRRFRRSWSSARGATPPAATAFRLEPPLPRDLIATDTHQPAQSHAEQTPGPTRTVTYQTRRSNPLSPAPAGTDASSRSRPRRLFRRLIAILVQGWCDSVYLNERLLESQLPWEQEGDLHWQRDLGSWRLVGSRLPPQDRPPRPALDHRDKDATR